ncbi:MAG: hypothetical protein ACK6BC_02250 [Cyanobacteriota bacterium]
MGSPGHFEWTRIKINRHRKHPFWLRANGVQALAELESHQLQGRQLQDEQSPGKGTATIQLHQQCIQMDGLEDHLHFIDAGPAPIGKGLTSSWKTRQTLSSIGWKTARMWRDRQELQ